MAKTALARITTERLPQTYLDACTALAKCDRLDECKTWQDKAAALAAYARMAKDNELELMASRIRARAIRREGELLLELDARGGRRGKTKPAATGRFGRYEAGRLVGLSDRQIKTAVKIARIDRPTFERAVESDEPLSLARFADFERPTERDAPDRAKAAVSFLRQTALGCRMNDPKPIGPGLRQTEIEELRKDIERIWAWLDIVDSSLAAAMEKPPLCVVKH